MNERVDFAEEAEVEIVDELAELGAADPTFGGIKEDGLFDKEFDAVRAALRDAYRDRFQHSLPADERLLLKELDDEVDVPNSGIIAKLLRVVKEQEQYTKAEEKRMRSAAKTFAQKLSSVVR